MTNSILNKHLVSFVADMKAAIYSAQSMKAFKNRYKETYADQLALFAEIAKPMVSELEAQCSKIEATAAARNCTNFTPEKTQRSAGKSKASSASKQPAAA